MGDQKPVDEELYFGGPHSPKRADGVQFGYTPYSLVSEDDDSNKITRECYDSYMIEYRYLDAKMPDLSTELWGEKFNSPIFVGGLSAVATLLHPNGLKEVAKGAVMAGVPSLFGYISDREMEELIDTGCKAVRIVKMQQDDQAILDEIKHDEEYGAFAVAMDIDHGFNDRGEFHEASPDYGPLEPKTAEDLKMLISSTRLPFIVKGVLSITDAVKSVEAGAAAILLSHHKGEMPDAVPPLYVLPEIKAAVGDRVKIFVDCGITSGIDAYKALALGADAVCVARDLVKPYMKDGAAGVAGRLNELNMELRTVMGRTATPDTKSFDSSTVRKKNW